MIKTILIILLLLGITSNNYSQQFITRKEAIEDINYFFDKAEQIHPDLYFKISKIDLTKYITSVENQIDDSISINDFSKKVRTLISYLEDGHTTILFSKELTNSFKNSNCRLPFRVRIDSSKIIVGKTNANELISGDELLSINGIESNELLSLKKYTIADNESFRNKQLEKDLAYYLYVEYGFTEKVNVQLKRNGETLNKEINLLKKTEGKASLPKYEYNTLNDTVGVLKINTFSDIETKDYRQFLDSSLNSISSNHINLLIIDLRNNDGGDSYYAEILLSYLNVEKYKTTQKFQVKTSEFSKEKNRRYISWFLRPLYRTSKLGRAYLFNKNGTITDFDFQELQLRNIKNAYENQVYILTSNDTYSSSADFAIAFKYAKRGLILGDTIRQPYSGYMDMVALKLPNSRLIGGVAYKKYEFIGTNKDNKHHGIEPDIYIDLDSIETDFERYQFVINEIRMPTCGHK